MGRRLVSFPAYARAIFFADSGILFRLIRRSVILAKFFSHQLCPPRSSPVHARERNTSEIWALITDFI